MYNAFKKHLESLNMSPHTIRNYLTDLDIAEKKGVITKNLSKLDVHKLLNLNTSISRRRRIRSAIRKYARFLVTQKIIADVPSSIIAVDMPKQIKNIPRMTRAKTSKQLLKLVEDDQVALIISLLATTGCRISSLAGLHIEDFNVASITFKVCKGGKFYVSLLTEDTRRLFNIVRNRRTHGPLFLTKIGMKATPDSLRMRMIRVLGKNYVNPHSFRHGIATELVENGADLPVVKTFMNHSSISITEQYIHLSNSYIKKKVENTHPMLSD